MTEGKEEFKPSDFGDYLVEKLRSRDRREIEELLEGLDELAKAADAEETEGESRMEDSNG